MNKGFTLIELLVVVLIIGILAAIALPQYTKAVERSRMAEAVQKLGDLAVAQSIYYMQNNNFANATQILSGDIQFAGLDTDSYVITVPATIADGASSVDMVAKRDGGMYDTAEIAIRVKDDGSIQKICKTQPANTDFCKVAGAMGYHGTNSDAAVATFS